jgi:hypothetical protein
VVDKIDRPDPVSKYEILSTKETHDEGQKKQDERREDEDEFSTPGTEQSWNKYRTASPTRQVITLQRNDIRQAIFHQTMLQSRTAILEMDFILTDGRMLPRAHFVSSNLDDYWKWKGWMPGQVIPLDLMIQDPVIQLSIQQLSSPARASGESTGTARVRAASVRRRRLNWFQRVIRKLARWW